MEDKDELFDFLAKFFTPTEKTFQQFWQRKVAPFAPVVVAEISLKNKRAAQENRYRFPPVARIL